MGRSRRGFSLIELLIVVSIIMIIAAIAIPDLLKSKTAANQASAVGSLRMIVSAEISYSSTYTIGYSSTLAQLDGNAVPSTSASAGLIDSVLASGVKSGYNIYYVPCVVPAVPNDGTLAAGPCGGPPITAFQVSANPSGGKGFGNYFFTDPSAVIRQNATAPAGPTDSPVGG
ncbi:MAG TPA: prepilin-type N-terminal cleavage/methylation domain-containing protein [Terriglobia bacterium]|nr:prepilin-type N-terminal cleavage/methylation domain-containing protein [Terriglobia bacterium]